MQENLKRYEECLTNKEWRLRNLYHIKNQNGQTILFEPNKAQQHLMKGCHPFNIVLKARQLGVTTYGCIDMLDDCLFTSDITAVLIADDLNDAKKLLNDKVKFAYHRLPEELKEKRKLLNDSTEVMRFDNGSSISVSTSARSGTVQRLHITEFGKICRKDPLKAEEIMSGSLNAVHQGQQIIIESTAQGTTGHFYELCQKAMKKQRLCQTLTNLDFKFHFFPWWDDIKYRMAGDMRDLPNHLITYFEDLRENHDIVLDEEQRFWYWKKRDEQGDDLMKQEFPGFPEEAFEKSIVGAYFAKELVNLERKQRIMNISIDPAYPVHTAWDLGINDTTCIWFFQKTGFDYRMVDYYEMSEEPLPHYFKILTDRGYNYGQHYAPHDIAKRSYHDGKDGMEIAQQYGYRLERITRPQRKMDSIGAARLILARCWFDNRNCESGLQRLREYRKAWNDRLGCFADHPLHDINSNGADAFQTFALAANRIDNTTEFNSYDEYHQEYGEDYTQSNSITGY